MRAGMRDQLCTLTPGAQRLGYEQRSVAIRTKRQAIDQAKGPYGMHVLRCTPPKMRFENLADSYCDYCDLESSEDGLPCGGGRRSGAGAGAFCSSIDEEECIPFGQKCGHGRFGNPKGLMAARGLHANEIPSWKCSGNQSKAMVGVLSMLATILFSEALRRSHACAPHMLHWKSNWQ